MTYIKHKSDESMEDYLETILFLQQRNGFVRSVDIAAELGFSKASVSVAMKSLREKELITMADNGYISLTVSGQKKAELVSERHTLLTNWLIRLGVSGDTAAADACRMEHDISEETFQALKKHCIE